MAEHRKLNCTCRPRFLDLESAIQPELGLVAPEDMREYPFSPVRHGQICVARVVGPDEGGHDAANGRRPTELIFFESRATD